MTTISNTWRIEKLDYSEFKVWTLRYGEKTYRFAVSLRALADKCYRPYLARQLRWARQEMRAKA